MLLVDKDVIELGVLYLANVLSFSFIIITYLPTHLNFWINNHIAYENFLFYFFLSKLYAFNFFSLVMLHCKGPVVLCYIKSEMMVNTFVFPVFKRVLKTSETNLVIEIRTVMAY